MKLFYADRFSDSQDGSLYLAMLLYNLSICVISVSWYLFVGTPLKFSRYRRGTRFVESLVIE